MDVDVRDDLPDDFPDWKEAQSDQVECGEEADYAALLGWSDYGYLDDLERDPVACMYARVVSRGLFRKERVIGCLKGMYVKEQAARVFQALLRDGTHAPSKEIETARVVELIRKAFDLRFGSEIVDQHIFDALPATLPREIAGLVVPFLDVDDFHAAYCKVGHRVGVRDVTESWRSTPVANTLAFGIRLATLFKMEVRGQWRSMESMSFVTSDRMARIDRALRALGLTQKQLNDRPYCVVLSHRMRSPGDGVPCSF